MVPAQCPHAPVTLHCNTCGGCRDALEGHYLCCSGLDKCNNTLLHGAGGHHSRRAGSASLVKCTPALRRAHARVANGLQCHIKGKSLND